MRGRGLLCREAPSLALPSEEPVGDEREILGGEAASLREAPLPPDPSLPKSGWRLAGVDSSSLVPPEGWARFLANRLWSRRLTEPPRPSNYRPRRGRRFPKGDRKAARRAPSFGRARRHEIPPPQRRNLPWLLPQKELSAATLTEDKPLCRGVHCLGRKYIFHHPLLRKEARVAAKPPQVSVSPLTRRGGGLSDRPRHPFGPQYHSRRW